MDLPRWPRRLTITRRYAIYQFPPAKLTAIRQKTFQQQPDPTLGTSDVAKAGEPLAATPVDYPMDEGMHQDVYAFDGLDSQKTTSDGPSVVDEATLSDQVVDSHAAKTSPTLRAPSIPTMSASTSEEPLPIFTASQPSVQSGLDTGPSLISTSELLPHISNPIALPPTAVLPINNSASIETDPPTDSRMNGHLPNSQERSRGPLSNRADSDDTQGRPLSSRDSLNSVANGTICHSVKQEPVSETEVMQFLNSVPLDSKASLIYDIDGLSQSVTVPAREPRKVEFGPEMVVIAARKGSPSKDTLAINFDIDDRQMSLISVWQNRHKLTE